MQKAHFPYTFFHTLFVETMKIAGEEKGSWLEYWRKGGDYHCEVCLEEPTNYLVSEKYEKRKDGVSVFWLGHRWLLGLRLGGLSL